MDDRKERKDAAPEAVRLTTIVIEREKTKKAGKRNYSRGLRVPGEIERTGSRVLERLARSVEEGIGTWRRESDKSARKKRDGAFRDSPENLAEAVARSLRVASRAPAEAVKGLSNLRVRKVTRRIVSTILG